MADQITMANVLVALGHDLKRKPPHSSTLIFEVKEGPKEHYVKILYNDEELAIPSCDDKHKCTVKEFHKHVESRKFHADPANKCTKKDIDLIE